MNSLDIRKRNGENTSYFASPDKNISIAMGNILTWLFGDRHVVNHGIAGDVPPPPPVIRGGGRQAERSWRRLGRLQRAPNGRWEAGRRTGRLVRTGVAQSWDIRRI